MASTLLEAVETRAQQALTRSPIYELRELRVVRREDGSLLIRGAVSSFYYKQLAQELIRSVAEGIRVENQVSVG